MKKKQHCKGAAWVVCCLLNIKCVCPATRQNHSDTHECGPFFSIYCFFLVCFYLLKAAAGNISGIRLNCQKLEQQNKMFYNPLYQDITLITLLNVDNAKFCKCRYGCQRMIMVYVMLIWIHTSKSIPSWIRFFKMTVWITTWWRVGMCLHVRVSGHAGQSLGKRFHGFFKVGVQGVKPVPLRFPCLTLSLFYIFQSVLGFWGLTLQF